MMNDDEKRYLEDMKALRVTLLGFAIQSLKERGGIYPFARAITSEGTMVVYSVTAGESGVSTKDAYTMLTKVLATLAKDKKIRAAGLCVELMERDKVKGQSACMLHLEHSKGVVIEALYPYRKDESGDFKFMDEQLNSVPPIIFATS